MALTNVTLENVLHAYSKGETEFLLQNIELIKRLYYQNIKTRYSLRIRGMDLGHEIDGHNLSIPFIMMKYLRDGPDEYGQDFLKSFVCLINAGINPNIPINGQLLIEVLVEKYNGSDIHKQQIDYLLSKTYPELINTWRNIKRWSIIYLINYGLIDRSVFTWLAEKLIGLDININSIGSYDKEDFVTYENPNGLFPPKLLMMLKFINIAMDMGKDPNQYIAESFPKSERFIPEKYNKNMNIGQSILYHFQYVKNQTIIKEIINIILRLIECGLDKNYNDTDGWDLMKYVIQYGWANVLINGETFYSKLCQNGMANYDRKNFSFIPKTLMEFNHLMNDKRFGWEHMSHISDVNPKDNNSDLMVLLYENRYEKCPQKLQQVLENIFDMIRIISFSDIPPCDNTNFFKIMRENDEKIKKYDIDNIYKTYCQIGGIWYNTPVSRLLSSKNRDKLDDTYYWI
jgi:hypothetical protein